MMSHHGFRRDLQRFASALDAPNLMPRASALREEWQNFRATLHGHHEAEDHGLFTDLRGRVPSLAGTIDALGTDHRRIDPLLERGDGAFTELSSDGAAARAVSDASRSGAEPVASSPGSIRGALRARLGAAAGALVALTRPDASPFAVGSRRVKKRHEAHAPLQPG
jgi:hypothetical protein